MIPKVTLLLADNDSDFLETRREILENAGYYVIPASTIDEARKALEWGQLDLAILDIRMEDNDDPNDISGIDLAKSSGRSIPKIMLTAFPRYEQVVEVMRREHLQDLPVAVDFVSKEEKVERLIESIQTTLSTREVFIVHGRNEPVLKMIREYVAALGLTPKILAELASGGNTIIEKLEDNANVGFAVVLYTADDVGGVGKSTPEKLALRARQNVIFEQGFFIGKLGRKRVATLYERGVEIPSDYQGVIYIPLDAEGEWKKLLKREIVSAGIIIKDI